MLEKLHQKKSRRTESSFSTWDPPARGKDGNRVASLDHAVPPRGNDPVIPQDSPDRHALRNLCLAQRLADKLRRRQGLSLDHLAKILDHRMHIADTSTPHMFED